MYLLAYLYRHQIPCPESEVWEDLLRENGRAEGPMVGEGDGYKRNPREYEVDYMDREGEGPGDGDNEYLWGKGDGQDQHHGSGEGDGNFSYRYPRSIGPGDGEYEDRSNESIPILKIRY